MTINVLVSNIMMLKDVDRFKSVLRAKGLEPTFPTVDQFLTEQQLLEYAGEFDGILAGDDQITHQVLTAFLPRLKVISKWGTGLDSIDLNAAAELGVPICNSPGAFKDAVAEIALAYMLDLTRFVTFTDRKVRSGQWVKPQGSGLVGKKLGVVGYGAIGQGIGERAIAMGMSVMAVDPNSETIREAVSHDVSFVDVQALFENSDIVCLACNLTEENRRLVNAQTLSLMKKSAFLINVARGGLVNEVDLVTALLEGGIAGAGLDVYELEPLSANSPLLGMDNVVLGSHNANNLLSATEYVHENTLNNLYKYLGV